MLLCEYTLYTHTSITNNHIKLLIIMIKSLDMKSNYDRFIGAATGKTAADVPLAMSF